MPLRASPIPMPQSKITFKTAENGTIYAYYTLKAYRSKNGKPTSEQVAIGKKDTNTGMLIPNRRYFQLFKENADSKKTDKVMMQTKPLSSCGVKNYGNIYTLMELARTTGLQKTLEKCFPAKWHQILAVAFYILCEGNVMMYIDDWFDETDIYFVERLNDWQCSRLFASVGYDERMHFFKEWVFLRAEQEYIAYDVTSISTYSKGIDNAEWGYNRDNEQLPQLNIGMFHGAESHLPVYYNLYNGSITDKSHLVFMMDGAQKLGITKVRFVFDRGFVTENNLKYMHEQGFLFITAFPHHLADAKKIIDGNKNEVRKSVNRINRFDIYAVSVDIDVYGFKMKAHVFFDTEKQVMDEKLIYAHIERLEAELEKMHKSGHITKKHTDFFIIEQEQKKGTFSFMPDNDKIDERLSRAGFFILLSNDREMNSADVLAIYKGKDAIEKNFDQLKNGLDFRRLRTHI